MSRFVLIVVCLAVAVSVNWAASRTNHLDFKKKPPHYTGKLPENVTGLAHHLRIGRSFGEPEPNGALAIVLQTFMKECQDYLDEIGISKRLHLPSNVNLDDLPETYVGHPDGFWAPDDAWSNEDVAHYGRHVVVISVSDPPSRFTKPTAQLNEAGASHLLYVTLELSDYAVAQKNWKGSKAIELGTGHTMAVPWLTSLDQLAEVLQFKGVLYRADGRFVRAGAEAFHAQRTAFRHAMLNVQRTMQSKEIETALVATRSDLSERPLAWKIAMGNLLGQLTGREDLLVSASR